MFDVGVPEIAALVVLAIVIFGPERLPEFARKAAQILHYVRGLAGQAQDQLKEELGPEFSNMDFRDLNPKQFVKKHLLDEVDPIIADVKAELKSGSDAVKGAADDMKSEFDLKSISDGSSDGAVDKDGNVAAVAVLTAPYDPEAT